MKDAGRQDAAGVPVAGDSLSGSAAVSSLDFPLQDGCSRPAGGFSREDTGAVSGPTICLVSGAYFDFRDPESSDYDIFDVAHALAHLCRFTGHTHRFYWVAEHSVLCSHLVPPGDARAALLHDASEAFLGDVSRPLKALLPDYRALEREVERAVAARFSLPDPMPASVKEADLAMLAIEKRVAMRCTDLWPVLDGVIAPISVTPQFWGPETARNAFLLRYYHLTPEGAA